MHLSPDFLSSILSKKYSLLINVTMDTETTLTKIHMNTMIMLRSSLGSRYFSIHSSMALEYVLASEFQKKSGTQYLLV